MAQAKAVFELPVRDNDGRDLSAEIKAVEAEVYRRFGGWRHRGVVKGTYRMPDGTQAFDETAEYAVLLDEARVPELEQVLRDFHAKTKQEAIYLEITLDVNVRNVK